MTAPKRLYYKIGEACKLLDIQPYVLRYWETEFPVLAPNKSKSGQRVYSESELDVIRRIKQLLYDEGFTIAGAKKKLETEITAPGATARTPESEPEAKPELHLSFDGIEQTELPLRAQLDTQSAEQIETLRRGIGKALTEARQILDALAAKASQ